MSTMVNLGIGFQEPLTCPGIKLDEKVSNYSSASERSRGIYTFQLAGKWSESKKMSCHAILKNLYGPKMDVILTISFKITAEIEIRKHVFCVLLRWRGVSLCKSICYFIHSLPWNAFTLFFFTVNSSVNAARSYWTSLLVEVPCITH